MEWGEREEFLWTVWARTGTLPAALDNKPEIPSTLADILSAFCFLSSHRAYGMSACPITFEAMACYASEYFVDEVDDRHRLFYLVSAMDHTYLKKSREKQERESGTKT